MGSKNPKKQAASNLNDDIRLRLLALLPSFQKDVARIRSEFNIPPSGFPDKNSAKIWSEALKDQESEIIHGPGFETAARELASLSLNLIFDDGEDEAMEEYLSTRKDGLYKEIRRYKFHKTLGNVAAKYRLPDHLDRSIYMLVVRDKIDPPPKNWKIDVKWEPSGSLYARQVILRVYGSLNKKELGEISSLLRTQIKSFPEYKYRYLGKHRQFERDIRILEKLKLERSGQPVFKKQYIKGSYLDYLKTANTQAKELHRAERTHKGGIRTGYSQTTSREVGKQYKTSADAARKAAARLSKLSMELFGVSMP